MISRRLTLIALTAPALAFALDGVLPVHAASTQIVVVTKKSSTLSELSLRDLKRLYQGDKISAPDGTSLLPLNHAAGSPSRVTFDHLVLKMSPDEVGRYWVDRKIRGQTGAPKAIPSVDLLRKVVAAMAGALTYLDAADVTPDLKVVSIEGKLPTDLDYPLKLQ